MGLFVPFIAAVFIVPIDLALGCVSVHKKGKFGKVAVVHALIGIGWIFFVSSQLETIFRDPFAPNFLTSSSSESQPVLWQNTIPAVKNSAEVPPPDIPSPCSRGRIKMAPI